MTLKNNDTEDDYCPSPKLDKRIKEIERRISMIEHKIRILDPVSPTSSITVYGKTALQNDKKKVSRASRSRHVASTAKR